MNLPHWELTEDRKRLVVTLSEDPPFRLSYDAEQIDKMLLGIGEMRAAMLPSYPKDFSLGQVVKAVPDPRWATEPDAMHGNSLIHLLDPRFGWLHYVIPRGQAEKLAATLLQQVAQPLGPGQGQAH